jgi:cytochrome P450
MEYSERRSQHSVFDISAWYAFSGLELIQGPHSCIGRKFAEMEMRIILAVLVGSFEFRKAPGRRVEKYSLITMRPRHGLFLGVHEAQ